jgi:hypothetical protein
VKALKSIVKINLRQSKTACLIVGIVLFVTIVQIIIRIIFRLPGGDMALGDYLILLPLFMSIFIPAQNFSKLLNLGCRRIDFFKGCLLTYVVAAFLTALAALVLWLVIDPVQLFFTSDLWPASDPGEPTLYNLFDVFGFVRNGAAVALIQMFAFLLLVSCAAHTLTLIQGRWYGWLADALLIAVISVFTPIAPLRAALVWFFNMIIFHDLAAVQILSCLVLGAAVYCAGLIPIRTKPI